MDIMAVMIMENDEKRGIQNGNVMYIETVSFLKKER